ncbi:MAG: hypothetical protein Q9210_003012 [Variospora velana]
MAREYGSTPTGGGWFTENKANDLAERGVEKKACGESGKDDECKTAKKDKCKIVKDDNRKAEKINDCCNTAEKGECQGPRNDHCCSPTKQDHCKKTITHDRCGAKKDDAATVTKEDGCGAGKGKKTCSSTKNSCGSRDEKGCSTQNRCCAKPDDTKPKDSCSEDETDGCIISHQITGSTISINKQTPGASDQPCESHLQQAFAKYAHYLEMGKCICWGVLDRIDGCCGPPINKKPVIAKVSTTNSIATPSTADIRPTTRKSCQKSCCGTASMAPEEPSQANTCPEKHTTKLTVPAEPPKPRSKVSDLEAGAAHEHVHLQVTGMTCTSCATKLFNVLGNVDGIFSPKITFVTGTVEFDLDPNLGTLEQVLPRLQKETGFAFSQIISEHQTLYLLIDPSVAQDALQKLYDVCESVDKVNNTTYCVSYNPAIIGARSIVSCAADINLAPPGSDTKLADGRTRLVRMLWSTGVAALLTTPVVVLAWGKTPVIYTAKSVVEFVLSTGVQAIAIPEFYAGALKALIYSKVLEMDMLVVISITAAYGYSVVAFAVAHAGYTREEGSFFETSCLLITLVLLGRLVAAVAKVRAVSAVSMRSLQAERATLIDVSTKESTEIDARLLQYGDVFLVPPHSSVVTDGEVIHGSSMVNESMLTGESLPVLKRVGDQLTAGTVNGHGTLRVRLTRVPGKNSIADIANLVENALASKPRIQDLADKVANYFVPTVITVSLVVFAIWIVVALKLRNKNGGGAVGLAFTYGIAVLAVSCPCALGLAVPMVLVIAGGVAARLGVIIKQADALERGYKVTDVVFDKTGTITTSDLPLVEQQTFYGKGHTEDEILSVAMALTKDDPHPVSVSISFGLKRQQIKRSEEVDDVESIPGAGIRCTWRGEEVLAGNPFWLEIDNRPEIAALINQGMTLFCMLIASKPVAAFGLKSTIREEARSVIADLHRRRITCHIVSGDAPKAVEVVAHSVGIPRDNIASRHQPTEKQRYVERLMAAKKVVLFCGDGTNDAVAVAQANVGVQIGATSDVTRATADVVLLGGLEGLTSLLDLSKRAFRRITFNFVWSAVYNVFAILLAAGAFVKFHIPPAYAGLGEIVSVMPVIVTALTLLVYRAR